MKHATNGAFYWNALTYNARGNITSRSDVGTYTYSTTDACGTAGPHAVKAVAGPKTANYCYDLNGDMVSGDGRTITWSAFGMPVNITKGLRSIDFTYGPDRARFKRVDTNETGTTTTYYLAGSSFEVAISGTGQVTQKTTIAGVAVIIDTEVSPGTHQVDTRYLLKDHLGSLDVVTDSTGAVLERLSFDAWGKRRKVDWTVYLAGEGYTWQNQPITRGYTSHEQLDPIGLIHMNGRVYDPEIGRFLSADPFIQDATNTQALNAYSYVLNNPLSLTDPSGFFFSGLFKAIGNVFKAIARAIGRAVRAIVRSTIGRAILQLAACINPFAGVTCAPAAAGLTLAAGGSIKDAMIAFAVSFAQMHVVYPAAGAALKGIEGAAGLVAKAAVHGVIGAASSVAQGGSFEAGFFSGAVAGATGYLMRSTPLGTMQGETGSITRTIVAAISGGTASVLSGGKFANGAITGAMAQLYNEEHNNANKLQHDRGVRQAVDAIVGRGFDVIGTEVEVVVPGAGIRRYDILVQDPLTSILYGVEVKTTMYDAIYFKSDQVAKDVMVVKDQSSYVRSTGEIVSGVWYEATCFGCKILDFGSKALDGTLKLHKIPVNRCDAPGVCTPR